MGLTSQYIEFIESSITQTQMCKAGIRILELGDQLIVDSAMAEKTGKDYFLNRGYDHTSVDINGLHGSVSRDLTKPEQFRDWNGAFDVLTNVGTTEHVEPFENQYECFGILHDVLKIEGVSIHMIPDTQSRDYHGIRKNHCRYYYSERFFASLAAECGYELIFNGVIDGLRAACLRKTQNSAFSIDRKTFLSLIDQREYSLFYRSTNGARTVLRNLGVGKALRKIGITFHGT